MRQGVANSIFNDNKDRRDFHLFKPYIDSPFEFQNYTFFQMPANGRLWIRFAPGYFVSGGGPYSQFFVFSYAIVYFNPSLTIKRLTGRLIPFPPPINDIGYTADTYDIDLDYFEKGDIIVPMFVYADWQPPSGSAVFIRNGVGKRFDIGVAP